MAVGFLVKKSRRPHDFLRTGLRQRSESSSAGAGTGIAPARRHMRACILAVMVMACGRTGLEGQPQGVPASQCGAGTTPVQLNTSTGRIINILAADGTVYFNTDDALLRVPDETIFDGPVADFAVSKGVIAWEPQTKTALPNGAGFVFSETTLSVRDASGTLFNSPLDGASTLGTIMVTQAGDVLLRRLKPRDADDVIEWSANTQQTSIRTALPPAATGFWSDGAMLVWVNAGSSVFGMQAAGGGPLQLATVSKDTLAQIAGFDDDHVLFVKNTPSATPLIDAPPAPFTLTAIPRGGGARADVFTSPGSYNLTAVAVDDTHVYWVDQPGHAGSNLFRAARAGGPAERMTATDTFVSALAIDLCNLYYLQGTAVMAMTK
jgi:hypothetical protein